MVVGYARRPSVNVGEDVELVLTGPNLWLPDPPEQPAETAEVEVFRLGYYGGVGARRVWKTRGPVSTFQRFTAGPGGRASNDGVRAPESPLDPRTGLAGRAGDRTKVVVPGEVLGVSGVYLAKIKGRWLEFPPGAPAIQRTGDSHVIWVVRDDGRPRELLVTLPSNTWQAYNYHESRSLYTVLSRFGYSGKLVPATGTERAAKVSLDRPYNNWGGETNWVLRTEFPAIWWLERHGYDVAYTEDTALHFAPEQALPAHSKAVAFLGHGEYWTKTMRDSIEAARDAGTSIYNFGANTAYWRVRYETTAGAPATSLADARVLVCFKTVEGGGSEQPRVVSEADPLEPTTTFRDPGPAAHPPGTPDALPPGYAGNDRPESELFGVQYVGDDNLANRGLTIPADNGQGEFAGHPAWRHTTVPKAGQTIGTGLVGWEWDGIPAPGQPFARAPTTAGGDGALKRLSETDPRKGVPTANALAYLQDAGRRYGVGGQYATPPQGWTPYAHAVTYRAPSGALVFAAGTIHWSWGLGPHYLDQNMLQTYKDPRVDSTEPAISQATCNLLYDGGVLPLTPVALVFDHPLPVRTTPEDTTPATPTTTPTTPTTPEQTTPSASTPPDLTPQEEPAPPGDEGVPTPPTPPTQPPARLTMSVRQSKVKASRTGLLTMQVSVAGRAGAPLAGTLELTLGKRQIGRASFAFTSADTATVRVRLSRATRRELARKGTIKPLVRLSVGKPGDLKHTLTRLTVTPTSRS